MPDFSINSTLPDSTTEPFLFVTAGTDEQGRSSVPHSHARGQLLGSTRGVLTVGVEAAVWMMPTIHAVWLPPRCVHWVRSHGPFEGWAVYVSETACADFPGEPRTMRLSGLLREAVLRAASWPLAPLGAVEARIAAVICDEIRTLPGEALGLPMPRDKRLVRIGHALINDPSSDRDLEGWARWAGLSARTLSRRFTAETGLTFTAWRQRARLLCALEMLAADVPVTMIALDLGYATASAFIALFHKTFGDTPASYRKTL